MEPAEPVTSSGVAFGPAVAVGSPSVVGVVYARTVHGERRIELRRGSTRALGRIVVLDRGRRVESPALSFAGGTAVSAWVRPGRTTRVVAETRVPAGGRPAAPRALGGAPNQYAPRFPVPQQLLFNTRATATVARVTSGGTIAAGVKLPRGATFDSIVAALSDGDRLALWSDGGRVYTAREARGTSRFNRPARLSALGGYARTPQLAVTTDGHAVAVWAQSGAVRSGSLSPGATTFDVSRELAPPAEGAEGVSAIATTVGDVLVTYVSAPGQNPGGPLRVLRIGPAGGATTATTTLTAPGERTRRASIAVDASAGWIAWATAGTGRRSIRVARVAGNGVHSAPRTVSGAEGVAATAPSIALTPRGRGVLAWATLDGRIRAVTRAGR